MIERELGPLEPARPVTDQITTERLCEAQMQLMEFADYQPPELLTSMTLAKQLRGLSEAISDIVVSCGGVTTTDITETPGYDPRSLPPVVTQNMFERYFDVNAPTEELSCRSLVATPTRHIGASLGLYDGSGVDRRLTCEVILPTNEDLDRISNVPCQNWNDLYICMKDLRSDRSAYPFHFDRSTFTSPREYLEVAQELSAYFVATSVPQRV